MPETQAAQNLRKPLRAMATRDALGGWVLDIASSSGPERQNYGISEPITVQRLSKRIAATRLLTMKAKRRTGAAALRLASPRFTSFSGTRSGLAYLGH